MRIICSNNIKDILAQNKARAVLGEDMPHAITVPDLSACIKEKYGEVISVARIRQLTGYNKSVGLSVYTALMMSDCLGRPITEVFNIEVQDVPEGKEK